MNINIYEVKAQLSKLIAMLMNQQEEEIVICKNGTPVATLRPFSPQEKTRRVGIAKGKFPSLTQEEFDAFHVDGLWEESL